MEIKELTREFRYNGVVLPDPNQGFSLSQVRDFYATVYAEITSADIEGPEQVGAKAIYKFRRAVGTKGHMPMSAVQALVKDLSAPLEANWLVQDDAMLIKDTAETLRSRGPSAVPPAVRSRLFDLHREYCEARAA